MIRVVAAPWVLTGASLDAAGAPPATSLAVSPPATSPAGLPPAILDGAVALDGDRIVEVGTAAALAARHGRVERLDGIILPALVNAHLHLELSHLAGKVPGGDGLPAWIEAFVRVRMAASAGPLEAVQAEAARGLAEGVAQLRRAGVAAVGDVSNTLASLAPLGSAGLAGTVFHEVFGATAERLEKAREAAAWVREATGSAPPPAGLTVVESPHAVYSTDRAGLLALLAGPAASFHVAEDPAEREFVVTGGGPFGALRTRMGGGPGPAGQARSAVALATPHLAPGWLLVHCVDLDGEDLAALRRSGATVVLCPRSNRHISNARPPLPALLEAGVPLAVGTDSLASSPSLAPLAELAALKREFPQVPARRLLPLAWNGAAVGAPAVGRLAPGTAPGLVISPLGGARPADPYEFLLTGEGSQGAMGPALDWLARHHPEVRP